MFIAHHRIRLRPVLASVGQTAITVLAPLQHIEELSLWLGALSAQPDRHRSTDRRSGSREPRYSLSGRPYNCSPSRLDNAQPPAGVIDASENVSKIVPSHSTTASGETNTADVGGGAHLHYSHWRPFHHRQAQ